MHQLRAARDRLRRVPLSGIPADRRRAGDRSGLSQVAASRAGDRACGGAGRPPLRLSPDVRLLPRSATDEIRLRAGADLFDTLRQEAEPCRVGPRIREACMSSSTSYRRGLALAGSLAVLAAAAIPAVAQQSPAPAP